MPEKVLPDKEKFNLFEQEIIKEGFKRISDVEFFNSFRRLGLQAPRFRAGREIGFTFSANGLTVYVWTTFLSQIDRAREEDAGWVVIVEGDNPKYYSHPLMRTKGFLDKLLTNAKIAKERVLNRPVCPVCKAYMQIAKGRGLKSRYWKCRRIHPVLHIESLGWDCGLSEESLDFLMVERSARRRYRKLLKKAGKVVKPAMLSRKPWSRKPWQNTRLEDRT